MRQHGLNPIAAILIYWNTVHLGRSVVERGKESLDVSPELLAHIPLTAEYLWPRA